MTLPLVDGTLVQRIGPVELNVPFGGGMRLHTFAEGTMTAAPAARPSPVGGPGGVTSAADCVRDGSPRWPCLRGACHVD